MSTLHQSDNPFLDDYADETIENAPIRNSNQNHDVRVEFSKFPVETEQNKETFDVFQTYYYKKDVSFQVIFESIKKTYLERFSVQQLKKTLSFFRAIPSGDLESAEEGEQLESEVEEYSDLDFGFYFPLWTCLAISLAHLIVSTLTFKTENLVNNTIIFALVSFPLQVATLVFLYKHDVSKNSYMKTFFLIGVNNIHYLLLRFVPGMLLIIFAGKFAAFLTVLIWQTLFVLFSLNQETNSHQQHTLKYAYLEIMKCILVAILDFFI